MSRATRFVLASALGTALAIAAPVAAVAAPAAPSKATPTTTTTTPGNNAAAIAKLVIKADSVGHVNVKTAGASAFKAAKNGQLLHVGDTVQTDATGRAEIDYADTAYTRLDVNTTFTIKKLTDDQGNRQVDGSLDVGRTYNRTAALTQSQTFQQDGGGATAAVAGTAFVVTCTSATSCTFTAVIDNINLTGTGGNTKTLNPLDQCDANSGALCAATAHLTPDELALIQWIQQNVYLDLAEHGIGTGVFEPFSGTVTVNNGAVQSFTPSTLNQGFTPPPPASPPAPPPPQPTVNQSTPVCTPPGSSCTPQAASAAAPLQPSGDGVPLDFQLYGGTDQNGPTGFSYQFTDLTNVVSGALTSGSNPVQTMTPYAPSTTFTYTPVGDGDPKNDSFTYQVTDNSTGTPSPTKATVVLDPNGPDSDDS